MSKRRWLIAAVLVVLLPPSLWLVAARPWARHRQGVADRKWAEVSEPMEAVLRRHPPTAENAAARRLGELCAGVGLSLDPEQARSARDPILRAIDVWVGEQAEKTDEVLDPPRAEVAGFLSSHRDQIQAIEDHVVGSGGLVWASDLGKGYAAPSPPLLAHRHLQSVILAHALESGRTGQEEASATALEASWLLQQSLWERPQLISQLVAVIVSERRQGILRRLPNPPPGWVERLRVDYRGPMVRTLQLEAWLFANHLHGRGLTDVSDAENDRPLRSHPLARLERVVTRPYVELMAADFSDRLRAGAVDLVAQDPCRVATEPGQKTLRESIPAWNLLGRIAAPSVDRVWVTFGRAGLDAELTRLVLAAKARRAEGAPFLLDPRPSQACPSVRWVSTADGGDLTIAAENDPPPAAAPASNAKRFRVGGKAAR